ncbi:MAG: hypothetical protein L3J39_09235 [Verrucomicrobiales bacterium]|nr:hypothetical protein [Verrucomicrobiales bacterium]
MKESSHKQRHYPAKQIRFSNGNGSTIIFVTICTNNRKAILDSPEVHELLKKSWRSAHLWSVGCYTILPDHIHLFCSPAQEHSPNLKHWVSYWKSLATKNWPLPTDKPIWQRNCWDRQIRNNESWRTKWDYVRQNPVRHGLVKHASDWPYLGKLTSLIWHDS